MHRLFAAFVGETMGEYIRRMRLGRAVQQLLTTNTSVTQIALARLPTPAAFTKAFRQVFRLTPTQVRKAGLRLRTH
jgi:AraC family transcriptional regulator